MDNQIKTKEIKKIVESLKDKKLKIINDYTIFNIMYKKATRRYEAIINNIDDIIDNLKLKEVKNGWR